ncbi:hypothetical protein BSUW23_05155 [Bacillus spizizenii str. W23]|uniref:Uncharacterized protein n=2 Tax=Bacillus TaxID=1386 RepID=E0TXY2_BACSH|nr:hypothetical protein BSUW23_05155 [Bacillus spizizenii str. W23]EFG91247.1 hypothetical protein BSU6633_15107 [Bacillus spizizenii ATCC 6633 = JCM 2499]KFK79871.1 hypothetical protein DJ97_3656 [Bacillus spizizenii]MCY9173658.1 hypothetical protein [Bacillus spizizenii]SPT97767.1 Uncharacterised protein [Bacillus spizizenii]
MNGNIHEAWVIRIFLIQSLAMTARASVFFTRETVVFLFLLLARVMAFFLFLAMIVEIFIEPLVKEPKLIKPIVTVMFPFM